MTTKQKVEQLARERGITIERLPAKIDDEAWPSIELNAPEGHRFNDDTHALLSFTWADALDDVQSYEITPCPDDCDCKAVGP